jgi:hypothetical protein
LTLFTLRDSARSMGGCMRERISAVLCTATVLLALSGNPGSGQQCDDGDVCTANDMCSDGRCTGTFQTGATCDDRDECTRNDRCTVDPVLGEICTGEPADTGTRCGGGCGTCQPSSFGGMVCVGDPAYDNQACDPGFGPCVEGTCIPGAGVCLPRLRVCPDSDGDPCTDNCNFATGQCERDAPKCTPQCETCNASSGACEPANLGERCDDGNVCTTDSRCASMEIDGAARGACVPLAQSDGCPGDCNGDRMVTVNELVLGVGIALGSQPAAACTAMDANGNGTVEITELISAVTAALNGCG